MAKTNGDMMRSYAKRVRDCHIPNLTVESFIEPGHDNEHTRFFFKKLLEMIKEPENGENNGT